MDSTRLNALLLIEVHRLIAAAATDAVQKLGKQVPAAAIDGYITEHEQQQLQSSGSADFDAPLFQKALQASVARVGTLAYPPDGTITAADAQALESLQLTEAQVAVLKRVVAEAAHQAFFHFFALMDAVGDPELAHVRHWEGAKFVYAATGGPMLHDDLASAFYEYRKKIAAG